VSFYVYLHRRADTGMPFYVGKGKGDRASRHTSRNPHWLNIVAKVGDPVIEFVAAGIDEELALLVEVEQISKFRRMGVRLSNITDGGEGASGFSRVQTPEEVARRVSANTGKKRTPEQCARIAAAKVGHGVGRAQSPEVVEKRIAPLRGKPRPDVAARLGGLRRPPHVVAALASANDARYAERRARLTDVILANPSATLRQLSELSGCEREMVGKYKRLLVSSSKD
jgi:hypothetical protein